MTLIFFYYLYLIYKAFTDLGNFRKSVEDPVTSDDDSWNWVDDSVTWADKSVTWADESVTLADESLTWADESDSRTSDEKFKSKPILEDLRLCTTDLRMITYITNDTSNLTLKIIALILLVYSAFHADNDIFIIHIFIVP